MSLFKVDRIDSRIASVVTFLKELVTPKVTTNIIAVDQIDKRNTTNPTFLTSPVMPTPTAGDNSMKGATTAFVATERVGSVIQVANYTTGTMATGTSTIPLDNTIPQITEGTQFMALTFTPKKATSKLKITINTLLSNSVASGIIIALFKDSGSNAVATTIDNRIPAGGIGGVCSFIAYIDAASISLSTFTVRAGGQTAGTLTFNGFSGASYMGGTLASSITIEEIAQ